MSYSAGSYPLLHIFLRKAGMICLYSLWGGVLALMGKSSAHRPPYLFPLEEFS